VNKHFKTAGIIFLKFLLLLAIWIISIVIVDSYSNPIEQLGKPSSVLLFELIPFLGILIGHLLLIHFLEKSNLSFIRLGQSQFVQQLLVGFFWGMFWLILAVVPIYVLGKGQLSTTFTLTAAHLTVYFLILLLNAAMQEMLVHGYLFALLQKNYSKPIALVVSSIFFLLLHPGAIASGIVAAFNVFGAGLIFGLIIIRFNSLLAAIIGHTIWNYFGAVWLGLIPLSNYPTMKLMTVTGSPLIIGDKNGMETSITVTVTILLVLAMLIFGKKTQPAIEKQK
jgi:uncharacterized protein